MTEKPRRDPDTSLPSEPITRVVEPVSRFFHIESASGILLLAATVAALVLANSDTADAFLDFWKTPIGLTFGEFEFRHSLRHWINDGLMVLFFFVIGLEVKRELFLGELRELKAAVLPLAAAIGGMVMPASLYLALQWNEPGERGWGIPIATDIAFVIGALAVLGRRIPSGLRVLLVSMAIADDIGAIVVIAVGYTQNLDFSALAWGVFGIGVVVVFARIGIRSVAVYSALGVAVWFAFHESGVHATIAGVALGLLTPVKPWVGGNLLVKLAHELHGLLEGDESDSDPQERRAKVKKVQTAARETISPLERLEGSLHPYVSFLILPLFALANAGVPLKTSALFDPIGVAIALGLCIGKPTGVLLFSWLAVRARLAKLPENVTWPVLAAGGVLAGIGFTMSLFIAGLALDDPLLSAAKIAILFASGVCAIVGTSLLYLLSASNRGENSG